MLKLIPNLVKTSQLVHNSLTRFTYLSLKQTPLIENDINRLGQVRCFQYRPIETRNKIEVIDFIFSEKKICNISKEVFPFLC